VKNRRSIHRHFQTGARIDIRRIREAGQMSGYRRGFFTAFLFTAFLSSLSWRQRRRGKDGLIAPGALHPLAYRVNGRAEAASSRG